MARVVVQDDTAGVYVEVTAERPEQVQPWFDWLRRLNPQPDQPHFQSPEETQDEG